MMPEVRIFGSLAFFLLLGAVWIVVELLFGKSAAESVFVVLGAILFVLIAAAVIYGRVEALVAWTRERLWWWRGPDSAIRVLLRWDNKNRKDPDAVARALGALPDWRVHVRSLDGETALLAVIRLHSFLGDHGDEILDRLLAAGADPNMPFDDGTFSWTPLEYAERYSAPPRVSSRLRAAGAHSAPASDELALR